MILIADSGSTKTDWGVVRQGKFKMLINTKGINPYFQSEEEIRSELLYSLMPHLDNESVEAVHFYGAGCTSDKAGIVCRALESVVKTDNIEVNSDLLAAARGICKSEAGIVCILGTGSNSCFFDGKQIAVQIPPLGFILGDEGSGAVLGKLLVGNVLKGMTSTELKKKFMKQFDLTVAQIINRVYREPFPNRFLASLSPFLAENIKDPQLHEMVLDSFIAFFERNVKRYNYKTYQSHFTGSVAFYYKEILLEAAKKAGVKIGSIMKSPMPGLISYHTQQNV